MGVIVRQSVINTLISYLGVVLGIVLTLWLYLEVLQPEEYGLTRVMVSVAFIGAQFADFGMKNITIRFFPYFRDREQHHHGFLFWSLLIPGFGFALLAGAAYLFKPAILGYYAKNGALLGQYYDLALLLTLFTLYFGLLTNYLRSLFDTNLTSFLQDVLIRLLIIAALVAYWYGWVDQSGFFQLFVAVYAVPVVVLVGYLALQQNLLIRPTLTFFRKANIKELANYGLFALLGGVATLIVGNIDIIMLGSLSGLAATGVYAIAFYIGSVITIPQRAIFKIANPVIAESFKKGDMDTVADVYQKSSLNQLIAGGLLLTGIWANLHNLERILPAEYITEPTVIVIIGLAKLFNMVTGINGGIILNSRYYRFDLYANIFLIGLAILLNYLLIPAYGMIGAAIATAVSIFLFNAGKFLLVWWVFKLQPFTLHTLTVSGLCAAIIIANSFLPTLDAYWIDLVVRSAVITLLFGGVILGLRISEEISGIVSGITSKVFRS